MLQSLYNVILIYNCLFVIVLFMSMLTLGDILSDVYNFNLSYKIVTVVTVNC